MLSSANIDEFETCFMDLGHERGVIRLIGSIRPKNPNHKVEMNTLENMILKGALLWDTVQERFLGAVPPAVRNKPSSRRVHENSFLWCPLKLHRNGTVPEDA